MRDRFLARVIRPTLAAVLRQGTSLGRQVTLQPGV